MRIKFMDGYTLTEKMRKARRRNRLTATEQALFHELVAVCNSEGWEDVFSCSNIELCCALNIDEKTLVRARLSLINAGLIYYKSGKSKRIVGLYSFEKAFENSNSPSTTGNIPVDKPAQETVDAPANLPTNMGTNLPTNAPDYIYKTKIETKLKDNIGETSKNKQFVPPSFEEVSAYCMERKNDVDPQRWMDHYTSNGWMVGRSKMKDWKAAVRTWERNNYQTEKKYGNKDKAGNSDSDRKAVIRTTATYDIDK